MATNEFRIEEMRVSMEFYWESRNKSAMGPDQSSSICLSHGILTHTHPQSMYTNVYATPVYATPFPGN
jgi:hypothetical protein